MEDQLVVRTHQFFIPRPRMVNYDWSVRLFRRLVSIVAINRSSQFSSRQSPTGSIKVFLPTNSPRRIGKILFGGK